MLLHLKISLNAEARARFRKRVSNAVTMDAFQNYHEKPLILNRGGAKERFFREEEQSEAKQPSKWAFPTFPTASGAFTQPLKMIQLPPTILTISTIFCRIFFTFLDIVDIFTQPLKMTSRASTYSWLDSVCLPSC